MGKVSRALNKRTGPVDEDVSIFQIGAELTDEPPVRTIPAAVPFPAKKRKEEYPRSLPASNTDNWQERLAIANENFSGVAENFRKLRTLILNAEKGSPVRSILILSTDPQEGKSFVCANLGVSFARDISHHALLVDCDLRRPSLHALFGLTNSSGITDLLKGDDAIDGFILPTGLSKLNMIPAGLPPGNPSELISSDRMTALLDEMNARHENQLLIIDSPPFQVAAETMVLAGLVDKIVLVVRWENPAEKMSKNCWTRWTGKRLSVLSSMPLKQISSTVNCRMSDIKIIIFRKTINSLNPPGKGPSARMGKSRAANPENGTFPPATRKIISSVRRRLPFSRQHKITIRQARNAQDLPTILSCKKCPFFCR